MTWNNRAVWYLKYAEVVRDIFSKKMCRRNYKRGNRVHIITKNCKTTQDCKGVVRKLQSFQLIYRLNDLKHVRLGFRSVDHDLAWDWLLRSWIFYFLACSGLKKRAKWFTKDLRWSSVALRDGLVCLTNHIIWLLHVSAHKSWSCHSSEELC